MINRALEIWAMRAAKNTGDVVTPSWVWCRLYIVTTMALLALSPRSHAIALHDLSQICEQAAEYAAQKTGVPPSVLNAISLTETGRRNSGEMRPWPWTVNMEGKGVWFETEDEARAYVYKNYKRGARSFDVGCFQINYKWHGQEFASIEEMFDPNPNALYAANFLLKLYREKGNWSEAAGAYHSRTQKYAEKYEKRFNAFRAALLDSKVNPSPVAPTEVLVSTIPNLQRTRVNSYPLLQENGNSRTLGSLVPLGAQRSTRRLITAGSDDG